MRELTTVQLADVSAIRRSLPDPLLALLVTKRLRMQALQKTAQVLAEELRVIECFSGIRCEWKKLRCRDKLRQVLRHGVALAPSELSVLVDEPINTVRSTLARMRTRREVRRIGFGRWVV